MYKKIILSLTILISAYGYSQNNFAVLVLQDGSIIKGNIIENSQDLVKIESSCGNIYVYKQTEIKNIEIGKSDKYQGFKDHGYVNFASMGMLVGSTSNEKAAQLSLLTEHDYKFSKGLAFGITTGIELLKETTVPLAVNMKIFAPLKNRDLYIGITGGYNFSVENPEPGYINSFTGGALFNLELGSIIPLSDNNALLFSIGYRYNELHYTTQYWWSENTERTYYFNRFSIRMGWAFY
jgi:hypothetical protein